MKRVFTFIMAMLTGILVIAQVPQAFKYQAVARNSSGEVLVNQSVSFKISVLGGSETGVAVYSETHTGKTTNQFGLVNLEIGKGTPVSGSFSTINWGNNSYYVKVEMDPAGGTAYQVMGTSQLLSVPYAQHAKTVEQGDNWGTDYIHTDLTLSGQGTTGSPLKVAQQSASAGQVLKWDGTAWKPAADEVASGSGTNPVGPAGGDLTGSYPSPTIAEGKVNSAKIQDGTIVSSDLADNSVNMAKIINTAVTTDKLANNAVTSPKIASMGASNGQVLKFNGTAWNPGNDLTGSSVWSTSGSDIYFSTGKVGIGKIPGASDARQFQVLTEGYQAVAAVNNSASYAAIFAQNNGTGAAADFRNYIKIIDGTQGADKVLTSDAYGTASWKAGIWTSDDDYIYNSSGKKFGMGINKPTSKLTLADGSASCYMNIQNSTTGYTSSSGMLVGMEGNNGWVCTYEPGNLYLGTSSAGRIIIASDGDVGIGISAPDQKLDVNGAINIRGNGSLDLFCDSKEALWFDGTYFSWGYGGEYNYFGDEVTIGTSAVPGYNLVVNGTAAKTGGGSWSTLSDIRLKNLKGEYLKGLNEIIHLRPVKFTYKPGNPRELDPSEEQIGFVAQDVQKIFPEAVSKAKDGYLDFNMHAVNVALINAVKELKVENDLLKERLEKLEKLVGVSAQK